MPDCEAQERGNQQESLASALSTINAEFPCRDKQVAFLLSYFASTSTYPLFICGPPSTGKTSVVSRVLSTFENILVARIDCVEHCTDHLLFEHAIRVFRCPTKQSGPGLAGYIGALSSLSDQTSKRPAVMIIDRAERLASSDFSPSLPEVLLRLAEWTSIRTVFVTSTPYHIFVQDTRLDADDPLQLHFPNYTMAEAGQILAAVHDATTTQVPASQLDDSPTRYRSFVDFALQILFLATNDLRELFHAVSLLYAQYLHLHQSEPELDAGALCNRLDPHLAKIPDSLYHRGRSGPLPSPKSRQVPATLSLPKTTRTVLLAAFLASHNPPSHDLRYFTAARIRKRKRQARIPGVVAFGEIQRVFPLERLLAIYRAIQRTQVTGEATTSVLVAVGCLVRLKWIVREGSGLEPKYRCALGVEEARMLARSVGLQLEGYLHLG